VDKRLVAGGPLARLRVEQNWLHHPVLSVQSFFLSLRRYRNKNLLFSEMPEPVSLSSQISRILFFVSLFRLVDLALRTSVTKIFPFQTGMPARLAFQISQNAPLTRFYTALQRIRPVSVRRWSRSHHARWHILRLLSSTPPRRWRLSNRCYTDSRPIGTTLCSNFYAILSTRCYISAIRQSWNRSPCTAPAD